LASAFHFSFAAPLTPEATQFLETETGIPFGHIDMREWLCVTAYNDHDSVVGVLTMEPRNWFDWHLSCAIADQRLMTRRLLKTIFKAAFTRAKRITALVEPGNYKAIKQVARLGFQQEGFGRFLIEGTRDALIFGMLEHECPWLRQVRPSVPALDLSDVVGVDAVVDPDQSVRPGISTDGSHFRSRKLGLFVALAALIIGVVHPLGDVHLAGRPAQMARVDASRDTATVGGVMSPRRFAVSETADDSMHFADGPPIANADAHLRIAALIDRERPQETIVAFTSQGAGHYFLAGHAVYNRGT
jgi:hypothetical protein